MIPTTEPMSPGWWMDMLAKALDKQRRRVIYLDSYYSGRPPLPYGGEKWSAPFQSFMRKARSNFAAVIVQAPRECLAVRSIRTAVDADDTGDEVAWRLWTANDLDVQQADVYRHALATFVGYVSVGLPDPDSETPDMPLIMAEDPRQVITVHDPMTQREIAAFKLYHDPVEHMDYAYLWLPGELHVAKRSRVARGAGARVPNYYTVNPATGASGSADLIPVSWSSTAFELDESLGATWEGKYVPVTRFLNRDGKGEFEDHIDLLDRINHMILQRLVIATLQAFKQRAIETTDPDGVADTDPETGEPIDWDKLFAADPGALWRLPPGARIWESTQVDLSGILSAVKDDVLHLAAMTATPLSMFTPDAATQTAEGASLQREGRTNKVADRQRIFGRGWARVISHAFAMLGDTKRADLASITIDWQPAERYSLAEKAAAAAQAAASLPREVIWREVWQFDPAQIALAKTADANDRALAQAQAGIQAAQQAQAAAQAQPPADQQQQGDQGQQRPARQPRKPGRQQPPPAPPANAA